METFLYQVRLNEALNPPEDLSPYEFKDWEVKLFRQRYDPITGTFLGLYETLGYIMVRGDADEHFLDYGYSKKDSKILHSFHKKRMPNSFSGTFFNRHRIQYESGALQTDFSQIFYFLPSITDRVEEITVIQVQLIVIQLIYLKILLKLMKKLYSILLSSIMTIQTRQI